MSFKEIKQRFRKALKEQDLEALRLLRIDIENDDAQFEGIMELFETGFTEEEQNYIFKDATQ